MEPKTAFEIVDRRSWLDKDGITRRINLVDAELACKEYAQQAVRMALEEAANSAGSALHLKAGEHYYPTTVDKFILSLESSIVAKLK